MIHNLKDQRLLLAYTSTGVIQSETNLVYKEKKNRIIIKTYNTKRVSTEIQGSLFACSAGEKA